jgi:hypothetical protein
LSWIYAVLSTEKKLAKSSTSLSHNPHGIVLEGNMGRMDLSPTYLLARMK